MNCEYLLICNIGKSGRRYSFRATTPEDAKITAREFIDKLQKEAVAELPFSPQIVEGKLFQQIEELEGHVVAVRA